MYTNEELKYLNIPRPILKLEDLWVRPEVLARPSELGQVPNKHIPRCHVAPFQKKTWINVQDYKYRGIVVPKGFVFDGASIPKAVGMLYQKSDPQWLIAALVHDWVYFSRLYPRSDADLFFKEIMLLQDNPPARAKLFYKMVDWFGGNAYYKD